MPGPLAPASEYLPWVSAKGATGDIVIVPEVGTLPNEAAGARKYMEVGMKAALAIPMIVGTRLVAGIVFEDFAGTRQLTPSLIARLKLVSEIFANALERKHASAEASRLRDEAQSVRRLATLGQISAAIAHELSHPLGAILANAQAARRLLETRHPDLGALKEVLDDMITGERRAAAYINKVRTFLRKSELHKEPVALETVLNGALLLMRPDLQARGITLQMQVEPHLPLVLIDSVGIEQVLINLIQNGADALSENDLSQRRITICAFQRDEQSIGIAISDTGKGVDSGDLARIFQPLFTTKRKGTGMGLAIARSILQSHGTEIQVRSQRGVGATFEFAL